MTQQYFDDVEIFAPDGLPVPSEGGRDEKPRPESGLQTDLDRDDVVEVGMAPEGHIVMVLPPGKIVSGTMAATAAEEVGRLAGGRNVSVLLVITGVEALTRGARTVFADTPSLEAVAVLGITPVDRVIANFLLGGVIQPCPTRYFSAREDAVGWLKEMHIA